VNLDRIAEALTQRPIPWRTLTDEEIGKVCESAWLHGDSALLTKARRALAARQN
jgi:hypothetical protein